MFFIAGVYPKRQELDYCEPIMCDCCSKYGRYEAFMEYNVFSLFFIPLIKFSKKFYVRTTCCESIYLIINKEKALMLEKGQGSSVFLKQEDMQLIIKGVACGDGICSNCGYHVNNEHKYCPNCGNLLKH